MGRKKAVMREPWRPKPPPYRRIASHAAPPEKRAKFMELWRSGLEVDIAAQEASVSRATAFRWQHNPQRHGSFMSPGQVPLGRPHKLTVNDEKLLLQKLETSGWMYQDKMRE
jgi:transposase